jgi:hypothetical protein
MSTGSVAIAPVSRRALAAVQDWTQRHVLEPIQGFIKTVNGQAAHDAIKTYMLENETVQSALATRLMQAERSIRSLKAVIAILILVEVLHWALR